MSVKLSILIPSIEKRKTQYDGLVRTLRNQIKKHKLEDDVEILTLVDKGQDSPTYVSIGEKCNKLMADAKGQYVCFIGDDDKIAPSYLVDIVKVTRDPYGKNRKKHDCITFKSKKTTNGIKPVLQYFGIENKHYVNMQKGELRPPTMITPIRRELANKIKFDERPKEKDRGVGQAWATAMVNAQLLKSSFHIDKILYYFRLNTKK